MSVNNDAKIQEAYSQPTFWNSTINPNKVWDVVEPIFWVIGNVFNPVTDFFTQGLSDCLVLETLRHGTSWKNLRKIQREGANPVHGGGLNGSCAGLESQDQLLSTYTKDAPCTKSLRKNSAGYFFVFADSSLGLDTPYLKQNADGTTTPCIERFTFMQKCRLPFYVRWEPHAIAFMAGVAQVKNENSTVKIICNGLFNMMASPLKIRMRNEEVDKYFEVDPLLPGRALRTRCKIGTEYMGLRGIFIQANDGHVLERIASRPGKCLWGLIRLINPIGIGLLLSFCVYHHLHRPQGRVKFAMS